MTKIYVYVVSDISRAYEFHFYFVLLQIERKCLAELMLVSPAVSSAVVCGYTRISTE
jgi:hypothetical protein